MWDRKGMLGASRGDGGANCNYDGVYSWAMTGSNGTRRTPTTSGMSTVFRLERRKKRSTIRGSNWTRGTELRARAAYVHLARRGAGGFSTSCSRCVARAFASSPHETRARTRRDVTDAEESR